MHRSGLTKVLVSKFKLKRQIRRLEYEGVHLVCFGCGMYGHRKKECPYKASGRTIVSDNQENKDFGKETGLEGSGRGGDEDVNPEITKCFGPWMLARSRVRRYHNNQNNQEMKEELRKGNENHNGRKIAPHGGKVTDTEQSKYFVGDIYCHNLR